MKRFTLIDKKYNKEYHFSDLKFWLYCFLHFGIGVFIGYNLFKLINNLIQ